MVLAKSCKILPASFAQLVISYGSIIYSSISALKKAAPTASSKISPHFTTSIYSLYDCFEFLGMKVSRFVEFGDSCTVT